MDQVPGGANRIRETKERVRDVSVAIVFLVVVAAVARFAVGQFNHEYDDYVPLSIEAPRAGLLMTKGSMVKLRGVEVGRVRSVEIRGDGALIKVGLYPGQRDMVPAGAAARIVPSTVFGAKYVELSAPEADRVDPVADGAVIAADQVTVETKATFGHLAELLEAAPPAKVNAALTAVAGGLRGRGESVGQLAGSLEGYMADLEPVLPALAADLRAGAVVADTYADAAPDLLATARDLTLTARTINAEVRSLDEFLSSLRSVSTRTRDLLAANEERLPTTLDRLAPTTGLLASYSSGIPCLFRGLVEALPLAEASIGGRNPGMTAEASFLPAIAPYRYPQDLPKVGASTGPRCYGLPTVSGPVPQPHKVFDTGRDPYQNANPRPGVDPSNLAELLFGSLAGGGS